MFSPSLFRDVAHATGGAAGGAAISVGGAATDVGADANDVGADAGGAAGGAAISAGGAANDIGADAGGAAGEAQTKTVFSYASGHVRAGAHHCTTAPVTD